MAAAVLAEGPSIDAPSQARSAVRGWSPRGPRPGSWLTPSTRQGSAVCGGDGYRRPRRPLPIRLRPHDRARHARVGHELPTPRWLRLTRSGRHASPDMTRRDGVSWGTRSARLTFAGLPGDRRGRAVRDLAGQLRGRRDPGDGGLRSPRRQRPLARGRLARRQRRHRPARLLPDARSRRGPAVGRRRGAHRLRRPRSGGRDDRRRRHGRGHDALRADRGADRAGRDRCDVHDQRVPPRVDPDHVRRHPTPGLGARGQGARNRRGGVRDRRGRGRRRDPDRRAHASGQRRLHLPDERCGARADRRRDRRAARTQRRRRARARRDPATQRRRRDRRRPRVRAAVHARARRARSRGRPAAPSRGCSERLPPPRSRCSAHSRAPRSSTIRSPSQTATTRCRRLAGLGVLAAYAAAALALATLVLGRRDA